MSLALALFLALVAFAATAFAYTASSGSYNLTYAIGEAGGNGSSANVDVTFIEEQDATGLFAAATVNSFWGGVQCVFNAPPSIRTVGVNVSAANATTPVEVSGVVNDTDGSAVHVAVFNAAGSAVVCRGSNVTNGNSTCALTGQDTGCSEGTCTLRVYAEEAELGACQGYDFSASFLTVSLTYDVTIPSIAAVIPNTTTIGYAKPGDNKTVNFTFTETNPNNYTISVYNSTGTVCTKTNTSLTGGTNKVVSDTCAIPGSGIGDGFYTVRVTMFDTAGQPITNTQTDALQIDSVVPASGNITTNETATVSGRRFGKLVIPVNATAADNVNGSGIGYIEFYANTTLIGNDSTSPYGIAWDTTSVADGLYNLTSRIYDKAGNLLTTG